MAAANSAPLNDEPAQPEEREKQQLPPKSYADAVEQEPPAKGTNGKNDANGTLGSNENRAEHDGSKQTGHKASVLRIVDTGAPDTNDKHGDRPQIERQESKHEYSATVCPNSLSLYSIHLQPLKGLDDTPRTPPRYKHRKTGSKSSTSSQDKPGTDEKGTKTNGFEKPKKPKVKDDHKDTTVFETVGEQNGSKLISVQTSGTYEKQIRRDEKRAPKTDHEEGLTSGKKAGQRWERSAIRFAPLNVPLHRRLQTLVVLWHTLCIAICISTFCFLCAIPLFWPLLIPYMIYCMSSKASTSGTMSHRSEFLRSLPVWSLFASYFPARLHRTQELPPTRKYIFGYHPHGIISMGAFAAFSTEALGFSQLFPGIKNALLTLDTNFKIPIYRDYALAMGLASVSKESCENLLSKGGPNKVR